LAEATPIAIVGCGPSGMAAANACQQAGVEFVLLEEGRPASQRARDDPRDAVSGVGGAGLFSDGKFSFFPSATDLWTLEDRALLARSWAWTRGVLERHGLEVPGLPETLPPPPTSGFKPYPSLYMDLSRRGELIGELFAPVAERARLGTWVEGLRFRGGQAELAIVGPDGRTTLRAQRVVCAGGRFFPLLLARQPELPQVFRRLEVGVRIEGPADHPFFAEMVQRGGSIDPKLLLAGRDDATTWRTFCCCRDGEALETVAYDLRSYSGRADGPPTGRSNVGFNVRFLTPQAAAPTCLDELRRAPRLRIPLADALASPRGLSATFGDSAASALHEGLGRLRQVVPELAGPLELLGPAVEGVGYYPLTHDLLVPGLPVAVAGDATGRFRGLVAALVSGAYVGAREARGARTSPDPPAITRAP
jgi:uncharacterized protein